MRLIAARSEVAAARRSAAELSLSSARLDRVLALVSSLLLLWSYYITFSSLVNARTEEITEKM